MTRLWLLRHAKSSWRDSDLRDRQRPLAPRGVRAAQALADHLRSAGIAPGLVLCSPAVRATQTWDGIEPGVPAGTTMETDEALYGGGARDLLGVLRRVAPPVQSVLLIGHNPGLQELAEGLTGSGDARLRGRMAAKFPTGALATLDFAARWPELDWGAAALVAYVVPREL